MNGPTHPTRNKKLYRLPIFICAIAAILIAVVLVMSGGSDDPLVEEATPALPTATTGATGPAAMIVDAVNGEETPATTGAIDGKGVEPVVDPEPSAQDEGHHEDEEVEATPENQATDVGPYVDTATRFAELNINRPTDLPGAIGLNKKLVELSAGTLATELEDGRGSVATSQVASEGEVLKAIPLVKEANYAEVLIVSREIVTDPSTGQPLDPNYLTYLVRLDRVPGGGFAVTSWEPQL